MTGILALLAALALAGIAVVLLRWKNGRFSAATPTPAADPTRLTVADIGAPLGERATLVQFSSAFCSPCRATRVLLADVAGKVDGVVAVDIDAEAHLELVRRLDVMRTPTVLVLDGTGAVVTRASGLPRREQVLAALGHAIV